MSRPEPRADGLIDSHCHLDYLRRDGVMEAGLARADAAGLRGMLTIGTQLSDDAVEEGAAIAASRPNIWRTIGVHPHNAGAAGPDVATRLAALADGPDVVGLGETGLDYFYDKAPRDAQAASFEAHLEAAAKADLPVVIHTRDAEDDTIAILKNHREVRGVLHCFTGTRALAEAGLDLGFHISFSGVLTFKKAEELREIAADLPADRLLVETDSPYLAPAPYRGKPCEPAWVGFTAAVLAQSRGVSLTEIAAQTTGNFFALFDRAA